MKSTRKSNPKSIYTWLALFALALSIFVPAAPAAAQAPARFGPSAPLIQGTDDPADEEGETDDAGADAALACDQAQFVADVTVPDGARFAPGTRFTKTWRLKNTGACTWTRDYELVFDKGYRLGGASTIPLGVRVRPGEYINVSVALVAPKEPGEYTGYWLLRNADGDKFGLGKNHTKPFWVTIRVVKPARLYWDLTEDYCEARWTTGTLSGLECMDQAADTDPLEDTINGFVRRDDRPILENGRRENEAALITFPSAGEGGYIQGRFPGYRVKDGDHFRAVIGCLESSKGCTVTFQLSYRTKNGRVRTLGAWQEKFDKKFQKIDVDLSDLAGKEIELILTVFSRNDNTNDRAFWLRPGIWR